MNPQIHCVSQTMLSTTNSNGPNLWELISIMKHLSVVVMVMLVARLSPQLRLPDSRDRALYGLPQQGVPQRPAAAGGVPRGDGGDL